MGVEIDPRKVELVNTCPDGSMLLQGPDVGGHCIPKDSWLLVSPVEDGARLIPAAREVNEGVLDHVASLIGQAIESQGRKLRGSKVDLLGVAYKENIAEVANSPGLGLYMILEGLESAPGARRMSRPRPPTPRRPRPSRECECPSASP